MTVRGHRQPARGRRRAGRPGSAPGTAPLPSRSAGASRRWVLLAGSLLWSFGAATASAQLSLDGLQAGDQLGRSLAALPDVTGDGVPEWLVGAPGAARPALRSGAVLVVSGTEGLVLWEAAGFSGFDHLGEAVAAVGDCDGDGLADVLAGAPQVDPLDPLASLVARRPGYARLLSGATGAELQLLAAEGLVSPNTASFGRSVAGLEDLTGDGVPELLIGDPLGDTLGTNLSNQPFGRSLVYSGALELERVRQHIGGQSGLPLRAGWSLCAMPDVDGDGVGDYALGSDNDGLALVSGASGQVLWSVAAEQVGQLSAAGDVDGDGVPELLASTRSELQIRSGVDGALVRTHPVLNQGYAEGPGACSVGDLDGDGRDDVAVGDPLASTSLGAATGQVTIYSGLDGSVLALLTGAQGGARFGTALARHEGPDGTGLLIGSPGFDGPAGVDSGRVDRLPVASMAQVVLAVSSDPSSAPGGFGRALDITGDVDNDGWQDVLVGDYLSGVSQQLAGRALVLSGRDGSVLHDLHGAQAFDRFGYAVARVGDVDRDGHADLLIASPFGANPPRPGRVTLFSGADGGVLLQVEGVSVNDQYGTSLAGLGDINGDGAPDFAVSAPYDDLAGASFGAVRLVSGADGSVLAEALGTQAQARYGAALAAAGDVDGDGVTDVIVGTPEHDEPGLLSAGRVAVLSGATGVELFSVSGEQVIGRLGAAVAGPGDLDGDGVPDLLVGQPGADGLLPGAGRVLLLSGVGGSEVLSFEGGFEGAHLGTAVAALGDLTGDGLSELAMAAQASASGITAGSVEVREGPAGSLLFATSGAEQAAFGQALAGGGDVDNDGVPDLLIGAPSFDQSGAPTPQVLAINLLPALVPWESAGASLPGALHAPMLTGSGSLVSGEPAALLLVGAPSLQSTALVLGFSAAGLPFKGGVLVPSPDLLFIGLPLSASGQSLVQGPWPAGVPAGSSLWFQHWIADPTGPAGLISSNALKADVP